MKKEAINNNLLDFAESLLDDNHTLSFRMAGNSMYPTLKAGELGQVEKCSPNELKIGDIVIFKAHGKLVAHRLIDISKKNEYQVFTAKGDKNQYKDTPFTSDAVVGKLVSFERKNKIISADSRYMKKQRFIANYLSSFVIPFHNIQLLFKSKTETLNIVLKSIWNNVSLLAKGSGKIFSINAVISALQGILPFVVIVCIKSLIDYLTSLSALNDNQQIHFVFLLILTALVFLASGVLSEIRSYFSEKLSQSITPQVFEKLHRKHASLDLSHYENPAEQDKIHRAVQEASFRPIKIINEILTTIKSIASALFLVGMFITIKWYLILILIIAIIPGVYIRLKFSRKLYRLKEIQSTKEREMYYFNRILTGFPFAKEMKLFGFFNFFKQRYSTVQDTLFEQRITLRKSELSLNIAAQIFSVSLIFLSLGFVSYLKIKGEISIGTVVLFFFAFQRGYGVLNEFFMSLTQILEDNTFLNDFMAFLNMPTRSATVTNNQSQFTLTKEIRIENASFRYESSKRDALKSINITIPAGKTVAFVGANGSGKTTMIKLLCGFYQPNSGKILFDGVDAGLLGQTNITQHITAVFQDFALYNLAAIDNLALGNIDSPIDLERARKAAQEAGIADVIERLPDGYNTLLGNLFKGGEELSIGQWQKMAIARAFYRDSPLILMDEPSSALDADAELQIISSLRKLAKDKTAVIISHRLSTVQWADLIYFFDEGEVVESGTHQELMALKGKYFSLFQTANSRIEN